MKFKIQQFFKRGFSRNDGDRIAYSVLKQDEEGKWFTIGYDLNSFEEAETFAKNYNQAFKETIINV